MNGKESVVRPLGRTVQRFENVVKKRPWKLSKCIAPHATTYYLELQDRRGQLLIRFYRGHSRIHVLVFWNYQILNIDGQVVTCPWERHIASILNSFARREIGLDVFYTFMEIESLIQAMDKIYLVYGKR